MENIKDYDHWKTIAPEPEEEQEYCICCGGQIYQGDYLYTINGEKLCEECTRDNYGRVI